MKIEIEDQSGFCFGVKRAINLAEEQLKQGKTVYCLGEIVHNDEEVRRLSEKGLIVIDHDDMKVLKDEVVLIRAHGEPPETYALARVNNLHIIEGTCPIVHSLQQKIKNKFETTDPDNTLILIYGKKGHPEVIGLEGQTRNSAEVVREPEDLKGLGLRKNVYLFSQTTMDGHGFTRIADELKLLKDQKKINTFEAINTICNFIARREPGLKNFASGHDTIIFVAGRNSSNGKILYEICKKANYNTYFVSEVEELDPLWVKDSNNVGICGATSTPRWQLQDIAERIKDFTQN